MDFWSRLIGGSRTGVGASSKQALANNPEQRLAQFKRVYTELQQTWQKHDLPSTDPIVDENSRRCLQRLTQFLQRESQTPAPHLCLSFVNTSKVYLTVSRVARTSHNEGLVHEALKLFEFLIDSEGENFLQSDAFAGAILALVSRLASPGTLLVGPEIEGEMLGLLFGIAAQIRQQPAILPVWFTSRIIEGAGTQSNGVVQETVFTSDKEHSPLFYLLLNYVHHEGKVGDFARTGLLYVIASATHSEELERWIVESDLATLMASGLGALYSQLSQKLVLSFAKEEMPVILAISGPPAYQSPSDTVETSSKGFQVHLDTFLSYLAFWQDMLEYCASTEVKQTLLDHFQLLFLQQLLYPSLLESSDNDGGSSVAVLTYLRCIIESIDYPELAQLILRYLLALPEQHLEPSPPSSRLTLLRRRKSYNLATNLAKDEEKPSPTLFNLADLVVTSLRSKSHQTIAATLRLVSVILRRHHKYAISTLVKVKAIGAIDCKRTVGAHHREIDILLSFAEELSSDDDMEMSYESHLHDNRDLLESHSCSSRLLALPGSRLQSEALGASQSGPKEVVMHTIVAQDPLLSALLSLLGSFFANSVEVNLTLTQSVIDLASCGYTRLEGWLLMDPSKYEYPANITNETDERTDRDAGDLTTEDQHPEAAQLRALQLARRQPSWSVKNASPTLVALEGLVRQVDAYRQEVRGLDSYLAERRHCLKVGEEFDDALSNAPTLGRKSENSKGSSPTRAMNIPRIGSISERLSSETDSRNLSRSSSPRGRQQKISSTPTLVGRLSHLHITPALSPARGESRAHSPSPLPKISPSRSRPKNGSVGPPDAIHRKIRVARNPAAVEPEEPSSSGASSVRSDAIKPEAPDVTEVSLSHLLTNVIILQEFILELAALVQVRASLFGEVRYL